MKYRNILRTLCFGFVVFLSTHAYAQEASLPDRIDNANLSATREALVAMAGNADAEKSVEGLVGLGQIAMAQGDWSGVGEKSKALAEKVGELPKKSGWGIVAQWLIATEAMHRGDLEAARSALRTAKARISAGAEVHLSWVGIVEHLLSVATEDNSKARKASEAAIEAFTETKSYRDLGVAAMRLGDLEFERDKKRRAYIEYENALRAFRRDDNAKIQIVDAQIHYASKQIEGGDGKSAKARLDIAESELAAIGNPPEYVEKLARVRASLAE